QPPAQQMQLQLPAVAVGYPQSVAEVVEASRMPQFAGKRALTEQEAQEFLDYYQAIGWMQRDGVPIRDWRLKIRKWTENRSTNGNGGKHNQDDNWRGTKRVGHGADFQSTAITGADDF
ncbi:MAG: hypothetical protein IKS20_12995, partial [Victivallales bacterium]|nr:hypothetical protein [Victivallales bacterium]